MDLIFHPNFNLDEHNKQKRSSPYLENGSQFGEAMEEKAEDVIETSKLDKSIQKYCSMISILISHPSTNINLVHPDFGFTPLEMLCKCGSLELVRLLLKRGVQVFNSNHSTTKSSTTRANTIHFSILSPINECLMLSTIKSHMDIHSTDGEGGQWGDLLDGKGSCGITPLILATLLEKDHVVRHLTSLPSKPNPSLALFSAVRSGLSHDLVYDMVQMIIAGGGDVNERREILTSGEASEDHEEGKFDEDSSETPLHVACMNGYHGAISLMIDANVEVNGRTKEGGTPLIISIERGFVQVVQVLLSSPQINPNLPNSILLSPLHVAALGNQREIAELLLRRGANPGLYHGNWIGNNPLYFASSGGIEFKGITKAILREGLGRKGDYRWIEQALLLACKEGSFGAVVLIMRNLIRLRDKEAIVEEEKTDIEEGEDEEKKREEMKERDLPILFLVNKLMGKTKSEKTSTESNGHLENPFEEFETITQVSFIFLFLW